MNNTVDAAKLKVEMFTHFNEIDIKLKLIDIKMATKQIVSAGLEIIYDSLMTACQENKINLKKR